MDLGNLAGVNAATTHCLFKIQNPKIKISKSNHKRYKQYNVIIADITIRLDEFRRML